MISEKRDSEKYNLFPSRDIQNNFRGNMYLKSKI